MLCSGTVAAFTSHLLVDGKIVIGAPFIHSASKAPSVHQFAASARSSSTSFSVNSSTYRPATRRPRSFMKHRSCPGWRNHTHSSSRWAGVYAWTVPTTGEIAIALSASPRTTGATNVFSKPSTIDSCHKTSLAIRSGIYVGSH